MGVPAAVIWGFTIIKHLVGGDRFPFAICYYSMAKKLKPYAQLSRTGKYYRDNPSARKKHRKSSAKANKKPGASRRRTESTTARRRAKKRGVDLKDKDMAHTSTGIKPKSIKANRGSKSDQAGDKRARGKGRKIKKR